MLFPHLVHFLFIFEFSQQLLIHPHRPATTFTTFPAFQGGPFFGLEVILEHQPTLLNPSFGQGYIAEILSSRPEVAFLKSWVVNQHFAFFLHIGILN